MPNKHLVILQPSGRRGQVEEGTTLRLAARELGVDIESICAENATCGKCVVLIAEGRFEKYGLDSRQEHLSPVSEAEKDYFSRRPRLLRDRGWKVGQARLSCQARVMGDVLISVPEESRGHKQIVRKSAAQREIEIKPSIRKYYVELEPPTLARPQGDWERLAEGIQHSMSLVRRGEEGLPQAADLSIDYQILRTLSEVLRAGAWKVTVTVWQDREIIQVQPGYHEMSLGAAVDIGTTTLALYLCDLRTGEVVATASEMNPQIVFGEDVMSRIQYTMEHDDGLAGMHTVIIAALNSLLREAVKSASQRHCEQEQEDRKFDEANSSPDEAISLQNIHEMVLVGNTTMHHLFLNLPPAPLGRAPYVPAIHKAVELKARQLGLEINPAGNIHVLPTIASFIGADTTAVLLAEEPHRQGENWLIIDVGTNAELVLGNRDRLVCTSTPTGPALEGAHIEHGMRAAPGAIERLDIDPSTLEPRYQIIGEGEKARGICGSAIIDAVAEMFRAGIIDPRGRFRPDTGSPRVRQTGNSWEYILAWADETAIGRDIAITQQDVRQVQLAKAALYVAARTLLNQLGLERPDKLILAGGFGGVIDTTKAMLIGMIPDMPLENVYAVGNAAGDGARIALLNVEARREAAGLARSVQRFELPADPEFQNQYMLALHFPHRTEPFDHIAHFLPRPAP